MENLTVEEKFVKAMLIIREIRPFYSSVYEVMDKIEVTAVDTMAVTEDKFWYNKKFVESISFEDFLYSILHEIGHVALMHVARMEQRDRFLWNIATDLYVNRVLEEEPNKTFGKYEIKRPKFVLYWEGLDINNDSAESIYEQLAAQAKKNGYFASDEVTEAENELASKNNKSSSSYQGNIPSGKYRFKLGTGSNSFEVDVAKVQSDLFSESVQKIESENKSRKILADAKVRNELKSSQCGYGSLLEKLSNQIIESKLNWKKILRKKILTQSDRDMSFKSPDKRMYWQDAIYPGQCLSEPNKIKGLKVCIDTSGSIDAETLAKVRGHIKRLAKQYKIDGEVIYWDTTITAKGSFNSWNEFLNTEACGGGGTDPTDIFEYFDSKACKVKPFLTIVLTDGYFYWGKLDKPVWKNRYKDTIWLLTEHSAKNLEEQVPFGRIAYTEDAK